MNARPVLLIDRDTDWCARVCRFLEPHGIPVVTARNLTAALATMERVGKPSALVMDISARGEHDSDVTAMRQDVAWRDVPVGYVKKTAALDALLLMVAPSATVPHHCAA